MCFLDDLRSQVSVSSVVVRHFALTKKGLVAQGLLIPLTRLRRVAAWASAKAEKRARAASERARLRAVLRTIDRAQGHG